MGVDRPDRTYASLKVMLEVKTLSNDPMKQSVSDKK